MYLVNTPWSSITLFPVLFYFAGNIYYDPFIRFPREFQELSRLPLLFSWFGFTFIAVNSFLLPMYVLHVCSSDIDELDCIGIWCSTRFNCGDLKLAWYPYNWCFTSTDNLVFFVFEPLMFMLFKCLWLMAFLGKLLDTPCQTDQGSLWFQN